MLSNHPNILGRSVGGSSGGGGGAVSSVFGRTGDVVADPTDYSAYYGQLAAANEWTSVQTFDGSFIFTPATVTVTANAGPIDITKVRSVATNGANLTLTPSGAGTNGQQIGVAVVNSDTAAHTVTGAGTASTISYTMAASSTTLTYWQSNGSAWTLVGGAPTINDLSTVAPATGDFISLWDISGGTTIKAANSTILALYDSQASTMTNKIIDFGTSLASDDTFVGEVMSGLNNSGGVTQWDAVYMNSSSQWVLADANGSSTYPARGLATATSSTGNPTTVVIRGIVRNDGWSAWTVGGPLYLSGTAGAITQSVPATSGDKVQVIGYAIASKTIFVDFNSTYVTVA